MVGDQPVGDRMKGATPQPVYGRAGRPHIAAARASMSSAARRVKVSSSTRAGPRHRPAAAPHARSAFASYPVPAPANTTSGPPRARPQRAGLVQPRIPLRLEHGCDSEPPGDRGLPGAPSTRPESPSPTPRRLRQGARCRPQRARRPTHQGRGQLSTRHQGPLRRPRRHTIPAAQPTRVLPDRSHHPAISDASTRACGGSTTRTPPTPDQLHLPEARTTPGGVRCTAHPG